MTISSIIWGLNSILALGCARSVYISYKKTSDISIRDYANFFIFFAIGFSGAMVINFFPVNEFNIKLGIVISLFFMFTGLAYLARLATALTSPKFKNHSFVLIMIMNLLTVIANVRYYLLVSTRNPFIDPQTGIIIMNFPVIVTILVILSSILSMFIPGIIFIRKALKSDDKITKLRGMLLGSAFLLFTVGFISCGAGRALMPMKISNLFIGMAFFPILVVTFHLVDRKIPETIPPIRSELAMAPKIKW